mmetsp:Transcript_44295/g.60519  ORF Transcript_44295/g.60519 Transcript_44295/m.60519 type:complete len:202 (+) Transcript_44295:1220-1825(+)
MEQAFHVRLTERLALVVEWEPQLGLHHLEAEQAPGPLGPVGALLLRRLDEHLAVRVEIEVGEAVLDLLIEVHGRDGGVGRTPVVFKVTMLVGFPDLLPGLLHDVPGSLVEGFVVVLVDVYLEGVAAHLLRPVRFHVRLRVDPRVVHGIQILRRVVDPQEPRAVPEHLRPEDVLLHEVPSRGDRPVREALHGRHDRVRLHRP